MGRALVSTVPHFTQHMNQHPANGQGFSLHSPTLYTTQTKSMTYLKE